jgi:pimeloyl-ACP methyl ester carboxylesterase
MNDTIMIRSPGGSRIDEGFFAPIHGVEQWITIRGSSLDNPVMMILPGPGAGICRMAPFFAPWEEDFTIVQWDQPGAGATHANPGSTSRIGLSFDRIVTDATAVIELVCKRLGVSKLVLLGLSGGTIAGLKLIKRRPDLIWAYVGSGQVVNWASQDALSYGLILAQARAANDRAAVAELEALGAPPYRNTAMDAIKSRYAGSLTMAEQLALASVDPAVFAAMKSAPRFARYVPKDIELEDVATVALVTYDLLRDEIVSFDARELGFEFSCPMFFLQGELDVFTVTSEVQEYANQITAPRCEFVLVPGGGHSCHLMREGFLALLNEHVRPLLRGI